MDSENKAKILKIATLATLVAGLAAYLVLKYDITWEETKNYVQNAPAWIFICTLVLLPPLGLPLSRLLFAVGARFGLWTGAGVACFAIVAHHFISLGISRWFSKFISAGDAQKGLWQTLEKKSGGNSSKLLFLWGLLPGLPYVVKLYLPLAVGVKASPYIRWNSSGHALGAIMFVGFGDAIFSGLSTGVIIVIVVGAIVGVAFKLYRSRLNKERKEDAKEARANAA